METVRHSRRICSHQLLELLGKRSSKAFMRSQQLRLLHLQQIKRSNDRLKMEPNGIDASPRYTDRYIYSRFWILSLAPFITFYSWYSNEPCLNTSILIMYHMHCHFIPFIYAHSVYFLAAKSLCLINGRIALHKLRKRSKNSGHEPHSGGTLSCLDSKTYCSLSLRAECSGRWLERKFNVAVRSSA